MGYLHADFHGSGDYCLYYSVDYCAGGAEKTIKNVSLNMTEKTIPKPLEAIVKVSCAPFCYLQAVSVGVGIALGDYLRNSRPGISFRRYLGEEIEAREVDFLQAFKEGYRLVLESYEYKSKLWKP